MAEYPSCLQTTVASEVPHKSSHTVPQLWFLHNSTRPSVGAVPPTSLMSLSVQTAEDREVYNYVTVLTPQKLYMHPMEGGDGHYLDIVHQHLQSESSQ